MCCPPVRGDNPRALLRASGLSYVWTTWYNYFVDLANNEILRAKVGRVV